jgi:type I restriction enzyme S subunit
MDANLWEQRKLGSLLTFSNGINASKSQYGRGTKMISVMDILAEGRMTYKSIRSSVLISSNAEKSSHVDKGDLVFVRSSEIPTEAGWAKFYSSTHPAVFSGFSIRGKKKSTYNPLFLETFLNHAGRRQLDKLASGSTHFNIGQGSLKDISVPYPQIQEQNAIGDIIEKLENTIALHQRQLDQLQKLKQELLRRLFPQRGQQQPQFRFAGFDDNWEQHKLTETASEFIGGGTPSTSVNEFWTGEIPWIQSSNLTENVVDKVVIDKKISENAVLKSAAKKIPSNSIAVVTRVGVGKLAFIPFEFATSQDFLSFSELKANPWFLIYLLSEKLAKWGNETQGTSIKGITKKELLSKKVLMPSDSMEEEAVGKFLKRLDSTIALHQQKLHDLQRVKQGFLQKMFL